ncbi:MAG: hypothetical protein IAG10_04525 [Planctomycetaceae bacterium]|nr:hypothetical protein [Planctomycetaceae bacterium]
MSSEPRPNPSAPSEESLPTLEPVQEPNRLVRWLRLCFGLHEPVDHVAYAASGFGLMLLKYVVEAVVVFLATGSFFSPLSFLVPSFATRQEIYQQLPSWLMVAGFVWTLPFQWIAVSMSIRRSVHRGGSPWTGLWVLVPLLNYIPMLFWCLPGRRHFLIPPAEAHKLATSITTWRTDVLAIAVGVATFLLTLGASVYGLREYGSVLFLATPLLVGATSAYISNTKHSRSVGASISIATLSLLVCGLVLLTFAMEGGFCIIMAAPIFLAEGVLGALIGHLVARCGASRSEEVLGVIFVLPMLAFGESFQPPPPPPLREVVSIVEIAAPPEVVWRNVVSFPELAPPDEWFFRAGIACPERARIVGHGVGATRYCEFSTGTFVEPIRVWDEPRRLAFDVTAQPQTMRELNPWGDIHPPHLDFVLISRRGEFRLIPLPNGRTRLEGRTWYEFDMGPRTYWALWGDYFIHRIHLRVLNHIRGLSEADQIIPPQT